MQKVYMTDQNSPSTDLRATAYRVMIEAGFAPDVPPAVAQEVSAVAQRPPQADAAVRDLRTLLWSSIDNLDTRDLDQLAFAERLPDNNIRLLVAIADVDAFVPKDSATDAYAAQNATSVYTGVATFPMLPEQLSTDRTSLLDNADRLAVVVDLVVTRAGDVSARDVYRALVRNRGRLVYEVVGAWLEGSGELGASAELQAQLRLQNEAAERLEALREQRGAISFDTVEARPVTANGVVVKLEVTQPNQARELIENTMIAVNTSIATFLEANGIPAIQRIVRNPERWPQIVALAKRWGTTLPPEPNGRALATFLRQRRRADPQGFADLSLAVVKLLGSSEYVVIRPGTKHSGHFGLAVQEYTHSTAPNRRYVDLVIQRLLKAVMSRQPAPYTAEQLEAIAQHCKQQERAARKVERQMRKAVAVQWLSGQIGTIFDAIVTGASQKGVYARLLAPPAEGRIVRGEAELAVGDRVRVRLISTDAARGFIDFERVT